MRPTALHKAVRGLIFGMALVSPWPARAADYAGNVTYTGSITSVAPGFYGHVGISLPAGETCYGSQIVVLLNENPKYREIMAVLLTAVAVNKPVKFYWLGAQRAPFGDGYCVV